MQQFFLQINGRRSRTTPKLIILKKKCQISLCKHQYRFLRVKISGIYFDFNGTDSTNKISGVMVPFLGHTEDCV